LNKDKTLVESGKLWSGKIIEDRLLTINRKEKHVQKKRGINVVTLIPLFR